MDIKKNVFFIPMIMIVSFVIGLGTPTYGDEFSIVPASYQGRFRPIDVYARLWLNEIYHNQIIKDKDFKAFDVQNNSAEQLLLKMNFLGHTPWNDSPLFWIHYAETKALLGLDLHQDRFSYNELYRSLVATEATNVRFITQLMLYQYFQVLKESSTPLHKIELSILSPGLWLTIKQDKIFLAAAPSSSPWEKLKPGMQLTIDPLFLNKGIESMRPVADEMRQLLHHLQIFTSIVPADSSQMELETLISQLIHLSAKDLGHKLEEQFPLKQRLLQSGTLFHVLPGKAGFGEWLPINALNINVYDEKTDSFVPSSNFTLYPDHLFRQLQSEYRKLAPLFKEGKDEEEILNITNQIALLLKEGYAPLIGLIYQHGGGNQLVYPSFRQLSLEKDYYTFPFIPLAIGFYGITCLIFCLSFWQKSKFIEKIGICTGLGAFLFHTFIICVRCFILQRPPVSNMFETVIYVPWIGMLLGFILRLFFNSSFLIFSSSLASLILLALLQLANVNYSFENVQAVLNSQYWLIIHVMLVVGSYGAFVLSGLLGHFYLIGSILKNQNLSSLSVLSTLILQTMYIGVAMLITGTILGGVWAAESWGRFWDWDPKESWAFISICIYLIWIHAYNFWFIREFGLAIGAILGLIAISFTWYGVNYILGTGLHSYGFGNGGEIFYYLYLLGETLFLTYIFFARKELISKKKV